MTQTWIELALAARDANLQARVLDISFPDLAADPIATARAIARAADLAWMAQSDAAAAQLAALNASTARTGIRRPISGWTRTRSRRGSRRIAPGSG